MKRLLPSLLAVFFVFNAGLFGESPPTATATSRLPIPATPGKVFDLAWVGKILRVTDPQDCARRQITGGRRSPS